MNRYQVIESLIKWTGQPEVIVTLVGRWIDEEEQGKAVPVNTIEYHPVSDEEGLLRIDSGFPFGRQSEQN